MRYFTGELWRNINSDDRTVREQAREEWKKRGALYSKIYDREKKLFPEDYIRIYEKAHGFHDLTIKNINMIMDGWTNRSCVVELSDGKEEYELVFQGVSSFAASFPSLPARKRDEMWWGYDEIGHKGKRLSISVLCAFENEFTINFKTVTVNTITVQSRDSVGNTRDVFHVPK